MVRILTVGVCIGLLLFGFIGCVDKNASVDVSTSSAPAGDGEIAAWVNGTPITMAQVDDVIASMPAFYQKQMQTPEGKKNIVEKLVNVELVYSKAANEGFLKRDDIKSKIATFTKQLVYAEYMKEAIEKMVNTDDAALQAYYEENKDRFKANEQVEASHILFKTAKDGADDAAQKAKCEALLPKATAKDADFAALAKEFSEGPSAPKGGELGFFERTAMVKPFADAAFEMKVGEVKGCVKSNFGYHIIKKTNEKPAGVRDFEQVKDQIKQVLSQQGEKEAYDKIVDQMKQGADVKYNDKVMGGGESDQPPSQDMTVKEGE